MALRSVSCCQYRGRARSVGSAEPWAVMVRDGLPPVAPPVGDCDPKISIIPMTVPSSPRSGAADAMVAALAHGMQHARHAGEQAGNA